jgi:hypothetical protein
VASVPSVVKSGSRIWPSNREKTMASTYGCGPSFPICAPQVFCPREKLQSISASLPHFVNPHGTRSAAAYARLRYARPNPSAGQPRGCA